MRSILTVFGLATAFFMALPLASSHAAPAIETLPTLGGDPSKVSVSGLSSGGFMAVQYDVAFSASTIGAGIVAGGPYNCALVNIGGIGSCMQGIPQPPVGEASVAAAKGFAQRGEIDTIDHLTSQKIYLFSGKDDAVVRQSVMNSVDAFYRAAGVPSASIEYIRSFPAGHAFIAPNFGNACDTNGAPYIDQCTSGGTAYDQPEAILKKIYGHLRPKATTLSAQPIPFNQREFAGSRTDLAETGFVYIPAACGQTAAVKCAVHVVFHGCLQSSTKVGDDVYTKLGYNDWADSNHIIVLYPQVDSSTLPFNPLGCWDWWGYTGSNFQKQGGAQLSAVHAMVERLTSQ